MRARTLRLVIVSVLAAAGGGTVLVRAAHATRAAGIAAPVADAGFAERSSRDRQIAVWHQALAADTGSALVLGQLAALHLQRSREGGGWDDIVRAEAFARASLARRTFRNASTASTLTGILLAQHRFTEAREVARDLVRHDPEVPEYRATLAEVAMELGDDTQADTLFGALWPHRGTLTIAARLARWLELHGHVTQARQLLTAARDDAVSRRDISRETQAWFNLRLGDLELRSDRRTAAGAAYRSGLAIEPGDPRLLGAMARLADAAGDPRGVIEWGEAAVGLQLDPGTLGLVSSAFAALGDSARAEEYGIALETAVSSQPGAYHRAWSLHLLDQGRQVPLVLTKAAEELRQRRDIYGWDVYAWALHKAGRSAEAKVAMGHALRLHTRDPLLARHAAAIGLRAPVAGAGE
ncbi:MAG: hypothetical protein IT355_01140 [Gemmatimonadaceae bacterium]|nr:hypothetical protein [Gemmatimonadaceae bacterium]